MIRYVVRLSAALLGISATLVIVGLFDLFLNWDIFSESTEAVLLGVFLSCITLAIAGVALTFLLGIHDIVLLMRAQGHGEAPPKPTTAAEFAKIAGAGFSALIALVLALALLNEGVQSHRSQVFKTIATKHARQFETLASEFLYWTESTPIANSELSQAVDTLRNQELFRSAALYVADQDRPDALWKFLSANSNRSADFSRRFAAKSHELAAASALSGDPGLLEEYNGDERFGWLQVIEGADGRRAVVHITANQQANFRSYSE